LSITNNTNEVLSFNTCEDITIRFSENGERVMLAEDSCNDIALAMRETYTLDLASQYGLFTDPGEYIFQYSA
jgi:hypothetical protein